MIKRIKITAQKYKALKEQQGVDAALTSLQQDIGSSASLSIGKTPIESVGAGRLVARWPDVSVALDREESDYPADGGTIRGVGHTEEEAKADFLATLLEPTRTVPYEHDKARISVKNGNSYTLALVC